MEEAGIDGGGLFKEFMECLVKEGFDPNAALFKPTSDNRLYPNPAAQGLVPNAMALFEFLGRMLAKAMYEVRSSNPSVLFAIFACIIHSCYCNDAMSPPALFLTGSQKLGFAKP